jgi:hypothetical protein
MSVNTLSFSNAQRQRHIGQLDYPKPPVLEMGENRR